MHSSTKIIAAAAVILAAAGPLWSQRPLGVSRGGALALVVDDGWAAAPDWSDRVAFLRGIEQTDFFQKIRGDLIVSLYNQKELWPKFGYEGSSAEHGGYINRGFADINWLPKV